MRVFGSSAGDGMTEINAEGEEVLTEAGRRYQEAFQRLQIMVIQVKDFMQAVQYFKLGSTQMRECIIIWIRCPVSKSPHVVDTAYLL